MQAQIDKNRINRLYTSYKDFLQVADFPQVTIRILNCDSRDGVASIRLPQENRGTYSIIVDIAASRTHVNNFENLVYHELTHIWDNSIHLTTLTYEKRNEILKPYTEIHASMTELKKGFNFDSYYQYKMITTDSKMGYYRESITIEKYLEYMKRNILDAIEKTKEKNSGTDRILNHVYYYLGTLTFCRLFTDIDTKKLFDFSFLNSYLPIDAVDIVIELLNLYLDSDPRDATTFHNLKLCQDHIFDILFFYILQHKE